MLPRNKTRKRFTPPTPSPSSSYSHSHSDGESLYSTPPPPSATPSQASQAPSSASTVRAPLSPTPTNDPETQWGTSITCPEDSDTSDLHHLHSSAKLHNLAFRIQSPSSSPDSSLIWTGEWSTSGFFPYNAHLATSPSSYLKVFGDLNTREPGWENGPYIRHTMVDHINGKMRQSLLNIPSTLEERPGTPEDEKSPWISGTRSLVWAIWEMARRLAWEEEVVAFAAVRTGRDGDGSWDVPGGVLKDEEIIVEEAGSMSELEMYLREDERKRKSHVGREILVVPARIISFALTHARAGEMSVSTKEAFESAFRASRGSEEVLWYGRVFAESIERNIEVTVDHLPLELPGQFWKSKIISPPLPPHLLHQQSSAGGRHAGNLDEGGRKILGGWLARLVWDPRGDDYERAVQKVTSRRKELYQARGLFTNGQPITPV